MSYLIRNFLISLSEAMANVILLQMLLDENSPLLRLPSTLPASQLSFLDGIRLTAEMYHLSYTRLLVQLESVSSQIGISGEVKFDTACIFLDAWSMVDSLNRFRTLVAQLPGLKQKQPTVRLFMDETLGVEALRNIVQHLRQELHSMTVAGMPVLGSLHWLYIAEKRPLRIRSCLMIAGRVQTGRYQILDPAGKEFSEAVGYVTLRCKSSELSLAKCYGVCRRLLKDIERWIENSVGNSAAIGGDFFSATDFEFPDAITRVDNPS